MTTPRYQCLHSLAVNAVKFFLYEIEDKMSEPLAVLRIIMSIYTQLSVQLHETVRVGMTGTHIIHSFYIQARQSLNPLGAST